MTSRATSDPLGRIRERVVAASKLSGSCSGRRRAPSADSELLYLEAKQDLQTLLYASDRVAEVHLLLSQVEEGLLNFEAAREHLHDAVRIRPGSSREIQRRMVTLQEDENFWSNFPLTPRQLSDLGEHLDALGVNSSDRTRQLSRKWVSENCHCDVSTALIAFDREGAYTDF